MSVRTVFRVNSGVVLAIGISLFVPLFLSLLYRDGTWPSFLFPSAALIAVGAVGIRATRFPGRVVGYVSNRDGVRIAVLGLFAAWIATTAVATFLVAFQEDLTPISSFTAVAATLNDVGPGLGQVGATESFEFVNPFGRVVLTVCVVLGRLEIFTVLALLSPAFWRR